jgi:periplasmic protein TonB
MDSYEHSSFVVAAVLSVTVHAAAAVYLGQYDAPSANTPQSTASVMLISLTSTRQAIPQPEPEPEPELKPVPLAMPETTTEPPPPPPTPVQKPALKPKPVRKPRPKPVIEPLPKTNDLPEKTEPVEEQTALSSYTEAPMNKPALDQVVLKNERESYLTQMLAHIDSHKFYPRKARNRGMEGEVKVVFYLHKDGSISDLQVSGSSRILRTAAKQAVQRALSLPQPPASFHLQEQIRFGMVYRLDG